MSFNFIILNILNIGNLKILRLVKIIFINSNFIIMKLLEANTNEQNTNSLNIYLYILTLPHYITLN